MDEKKPLVSIIVRTKDRPKELRRALKSIVSQTYRPIELIIVNDGGCALPIEELKDILCDVSLNYVRIEKNRGRAAAANAGLDHAQGMYLIFLDDDDWFEPDHISSLVAALEKEPQARVAYTGVRGIFNTNDDKPGDELFFNQRFDPVRLLSGNYIPIHAVLFHRSLLRSGCRFDENLEVYEDWDFWLQLSRFTKFIHLDQISAVYRASHNSGVGLWADENKTRHGREVIYEKWGKIWSGKEINDLLTQTEQVRKALVEEVENSKKFLSVQAEEIRVKDDVIKGQAEEIRVKDDVIKGQAEEIRVKDDVIKGQAEEIRVKDDVIKGQAEEIRVKDDVIKGQAEEIRVKDDVIKGQAETIRVKNTHIHNLESELIMIKHSRAWRMAEFFRHLFYIKLLGKFPLLQKGMLTISREGIPEFFAKTKGYLRKNKDVATIGLIESDYDKWIKKNQLTDEMIGEIKRDIARFQYKPKVSIIMPVYNTDPKLLSIAVKSVAEQLYENWELCIVDDCSTDNKTVNYLKSIKHPSIKVKFFDENMGISIASNEAVKLATGEYIAFMDHDDEITKDALYEVAKAINAKAPALIYSDEDKVDIYGRKKFPYLKPDWSPDLLRSQNYICHFTAIRKKLFYQVGGFRKQFDGAQDFDLFLRISEKTNSIHHIPKILYSWRLIDSSTSCNPNSKPDAQINGLKAVNEHLKRVFGKEAYVDECDNLFVFDARFPVKNESLVSIIIPTKDGLNYLKPCVNSIVAQSTYNNYEIIILDNNSEKPETAIWFKEITKKYPNIRVIDAHYPFNWAKLNNHGIREANGNVFIFLNNDTEIISRDWIERLAEEALRDDVGAVGSLLLYKDGTIQHAGVVVGLEGWASHVYNGIKPVHMSSPYISPLVKRNVLAVSGACLALSRKTIDKVGNFDENFVVCGSDVEICLRAHEKGLNNIYDPFVKLYHFESKTRDPLNIPACDFDMSKKCYKNYLEKGDPFFNKNFSLTETMPTLKECNVKQNDKSNKKQ